MATAVTGSTAHKTPPRPNQNDNTRKYLAAHRDKARLKLGADTHSCVMRGNYTEYWGLCGYVRFCVAKENMKFYGSSADAHFRVTENNMEF